MTRILQTVVPPLFPPDGRVQVMLYGEAPGPLGADKSGIPFWGDRAGIVVYRSLEAAGLAQVPPGAYKEWDGQRLLERGWKPVLHRAALSNAYPSCPTRDGKTFRSPTDLELTQSGNIERIRKEVSDASDGCVGTLRVVAMGRRAAWILRRVQDSVVAELFELCEIPHPSAQGLLQAAPDKGRGMKMEDLRQAWMDRLAQLLAV